MLKDSALKDVIVGEWQSVDDKSRDTSRRPGESLQFWGLKPGASNLEVQPGGGWWTQILAPYAARTGGRYAATAADLGNPNLSEAAPLPEDSYDFILVSRSIHGWMRNEGALDRNLGLLARALTKGGVLAIEHHRGNPGPQDPKAANG